MRRTLLLATLIALPLAAIGTYGLSALTSTDLPGHAGHGGHGTSGNQGSGQTSAAIPTETGQAAFAAIAEIVTLLSNDPGTDWSKVDITALRDHLVDMNQLTLGAEVLQSEADGAVTFQVTGEGKTLRAIRAMVPAHGRELSRSTAWTVSTEETANGMTITVATADAAELAKIKALGFFGIMATGTHHQPHHLGMATGNFHH